ncbi:MAG: hypothetical protein K8S99_03795 [Planctomycetes bacterium]|nr:hypothetical protein [Planctomycetota bacterium]
MSTAPIALGSRLELFVDRFLIDTLTGAALRMHEPRPAGMALRFDAPWELHFSGCITVIKDGDLYRMFYRGLPDASAGDGSDYESTCTAISVDGIHWAKPRLKLFPFKDHAETNIILAHAKPDSHNFSPFLDTRPGVPEAERYKAIAGTDKPGIHAYVSPDGIHWKKKVEHPVLTGPKSANDSIVFDSQNVAFWSQSEGCYVAYFRTWKGFKNWKEYGYRWVSRATSDDFVNWSAWQQMDCGDAPDEELYTQQTHPYFRAPHIYIALAARFWQGKKVISDAEAAEYKVEKAYFNDCSDGVLMSSRGGNRYDRTFLESFLRPGPGLRNWVSRTNYPALGVIPTGEGEMSMFAHRDYAQPSCHAYRFSLRTDGFVSVNAPYKGGELLTKAMTFTGSSLLLNMATSAAGSVKLEIQDAQGKPIPGFALEDAAELVGDMIEKHAAWKTGTDVSALAGRPVRLRFVMRDADLYSIRFA